MNLVLLLPRSAQRCHIFVPTQQQAPDQCHRAAKRCPSRLHRRLDRLPSLHASSAWQPPAHISSPCTEPQAWDRAGQPVHGCGKPLQSPLRNPPGPSGGAGLQPHGHRGGHRGGRKGGCGCRGQLWGPGPEASWQGRGSRDVWVRLLGCKRQPGWAQVQALDQE